MFLSTVLPGGKRLYLPLLQQRRAGSVNGWGQRRAEANLGWNPPRSNSNVPLDGMLNFHRLSSFEKKNSFLEPVPPCSTPFPMGLNGSHGTEVWIDASVFSAATEATAPRDSSHCIAHREGAPGVGSCRVVPGWAQLPVKTQNFGTNGPTSLAIFWNGCHTESYLSISKSSKYV